MTRLCVRALAALLVCAVPASSAAQVRTSGQIVGTVKDATGAVIPADPSARVNCRRVTLMSGS